MDGLNLYSAMGNNPGVYTDPLGTEAKGQIGNVESEPTTVNILTKRGLERHQKLHGDLLVELAQATTQEERERIFEKIREREGLATLRRLR